MKEDEVYILLNDLQEVYGYDFNEYSKASLKRRMQRLYALDKFPSFAEFRYRVRHDEIYLKRFV
ncbi:MAG TPA: protein-glutamate O-methyltransferase CheR, partial [Flavisolibacter sp.]|nr:protein-glutamate O-methyltransferase CheR [Flavisolibacter sp.]